MLVLVLAAWSWWWWWWTGGADGAGCANAKLRWGEMIDVLARNAKGRIAALQLVNHLLDSNNLRTIYTMLIRLVMAYGSVV